ncbi:MAG TPA: SDR family oxidoreductase [Vicinamibacterales bacterium]|nr:SDR family oxidoreductase [Vicinamibacterales bacterium]
MGSRLRGKTVFMTAAAQGIGRATALALAGEEAEVWATDINKELLASLDSVPRIRTRVLDVLDDDAVAAVAKDVGPIDVLFNCAGYVHQGDILTCTPKDWDFSFRLNVRAMYIVTRAFIPVMLARGGGSIINMASVISSMKGTPNRLAYGASKAAVIGFTKAVAADYAKQGIRCNCVCPSGVDTPSFAERLNAFADPEKVRNDVISRVPLGRIGTVDDITPLVVYLASDESRFATGAMFPVDGGVAM